MLDFWSRKLGRASEWENHWILLRSSKEIQNLCSFLKLLLTPFWITQGAITPRSSKYGPKTPLSGYLLFKAHTQRTCTGFWTVENPPKHPEHLFEWHGPLLDYYSRGTLLVRVMSNIWILFSSGDRLKPVLTKCYYKRVVIKIGAIKRYILFSLRFHKVRINHLHTT